MSCIVLPYRAGLRNKGPWSSSLGMPGLHDIYNGIPLNIHQDDYAIGAVGSVMST